MFMKKIKLVISVLLAISVIFASTIVASAATMGVSLSPGKTSLKAGEQVTITVNLSSNSGVAGVNFALTFNSTHLKFVSATASGIGSSFGMKDVSISGSSTVKGAFMNVDGTEVTSTGALATVTFEVIATSTVTSNISVSADGTDGMGDPTNNSSSNINLKLNPETQTQPVTEPTTQPVTEPTTQPVTEPTTQPVTEPTTALEDNKPVVLPQDSYACQAGNTYKLAAAKGMQGKITYSSNNTSVASVNAEGMVTTHAKGMATIKIVSQNNITKTWLLIVGDGSMIEGESTTTEEESTTEIEVIGGDVPENNINIEEKTTADTDNEKKKNNNDEDDLLKIILIAGGGAALIAIVIVVVSLIRKKKSFE